MNPYKECPEGSYSLRNLKKWFWFTQHFFLLERLGYWTVCHAGLSHAIPTSVLLWNALYLMPQEISSTSPTNPQHSLEVKGTTSSNRFFPWTFGTPISSRINAAPETGVSLVPQPWQDRLKLLQHLFIFRNAGHSLLAMISVSHLPWTLITKLNLNFRTFRKHSHEVSSVKLLLPSNKFRKYWLMTYFPS